MDKIQTILRLLSKFPLYCPYALIVVFLSITQASQSLEVLY